MGASLASKGSLSGRVALNEGLSRRIPLRERMVYVDWSEDLVGIVSESFVIQAPRHLNFRKRLVTDFGCFLQDDEETEVVFTKLSRVYDTSGALHQGSSSFYTLHRSGLEGNEPEDGDDSTFLSS